MIIPSFQCEDADVQVFGATADVHVLEPRPESQISFGMEQVFVFVSKGALAPIPDEHWSETQWGLP